MADPALDYWLLPYWCGRPNHLVLSYIPFPEKKIEGAPTDQSSWQAVGLILVGFQFGYAQVGVFKLVWDKFNNISVYKHSRTHIDIVLAVAF
jgi:hypothetical protein